ncbi:increased DNA methylation 3-like [Diospyros lotus]|uniref:increased DNA methylation 3-like n=1 Tax=Diospyros lotus TaxID=55363 RepID=UPI00225283B7|nr:increased DNA methylation 3-like [Diospyros lotus]
MRTEESAVPNEFNPNVVRTGTAKEGSFGPTLGLMDIGVSPTAYLCLIALPGVRNNGHELQIDIHRDGNVTIKGTSTGGRLLKDLPTIAHAVMVVQQVSPPGEFTISFSLPGPVDPKLFEADLRPDGILEIMLMKISVRVVQG